MATLPRRLALCFEVWAKQLSKLLLDKGYLSGTTGATKGKQKQSHTAACEGDVAGDDPSPHQEVNEAYHHCKSFITSFIHKEASHHRKSSITHHSEACHNCKSSQDHILIFVIRHQHSSTGSTKMGIFMTTPE